jgi:hypothetical protein
LRTEAFLHTAESEPRWPSVLAILVAIGISLSVPTVMAAGTGAGTAAQLAVPAFAFALLLPLALTSPHRHAAESARHRGAAVALTALLTAANVLGLGILIRGLTDQAIGGTRVLAAAALIWGTNVIAFALWYWELDGGGPPRRLADPEGRRDFGFAQMAAPQLGTADWLPGFVDYLYLSFTNASAFSPADTVPLTPLAKLLMLAQSSIALVTVVLVAAHAVNMLG